MKDSESNFFTYPLHQYLISGSATDSLESQILCPSYQKKTSKKHVQNRNILKNYKKYDDDGMYTSNQNKTLKLVQKPNIIPT